MMQQSDGSFSCSDITEISNIHPVQRSHGIFRCEVLREATNGGSHSAMKSFAKSRKNDERDPAELQRNRDAFRREYELLASFKDANSNTAHPHIVSVTAYFEVYLDYGPLFLMELAECSLFDVLKDEVAYQTDDAEGKYSFSHCISFLFQISTALKYLHGGIRFNNEVKPVIHRDLKSCNVLLFNQGRLCKLCDFDTSRPIENIMTGGVGTPGWRAPELMPHSSDRRLAYTVAADCFSFGALCLEALFREIPDKIGKPYCPTDYQSADSIIYFCERTRLVARLNDSKFKDSAAFGLQMFVIKDLLSGLLDDEPDKRITASQAFETLRGLAPQSVSPLYGPEIPHTSMGVGQREVSEPIVLESTVEHPRISTSEPNEFVSVFYTVKQANSNAEFNDNDWKSIKKVMEVMIETLNTLASPTETPCTASCCICLDTTNLILEIKIKQSNKNEVSVLEWCQNNEKKCSQQFSKFFSEDPIVKLQDLVFGMRIPSQFMPDADVEREDTPARSTRSRAYAFLRDACALIRPHVLDIIRFVTDRFGIRVTYNI